MTKFWSPQARQELYYACYAQRSDGQTVACCKATVMGTAFSRSSLPHATAASLQALLADSDTAVRNCGTSAAATLAALTSDLAARYNASTRVALAQVASFRSALLARKTRVLGDAKRLSHKQCKRIVADLEAVDVSVEQLLVWAALAATACPNLDRALECASAVSPLLPSPRQVPDCDTGLKSSAALSFAGELASVVTGDGLRVVSAAGPGLQWFEPHSRNEFSVVLASADGSVPMWLITSDVVVTAAGNIPTTVAATVGPNHGTVSVGYVYGGLRDDAADVVLQLTVCGVAVTDAASDSDWAACVSLRPLAGHECAALGTHVRTLAAVGDVSARGMAVSADEKWLVVGLAREGRVHVYSLPGGEFVRTFGGRGDRRLQFNFLGRLCFAPNGNLIVADQDNKRLQEVTVEGVFVRFIGVGIFGNLTDGDPFAVAVHNDVIAVACVKGAGPRVVLFDFVVGTVTSRFGTVGTTPGELDEGCTGIRFTPDGSHLIVAEGWHVTKRLSVFTTAGLFVRCVGARVLGFGYLDVLQSASGEYVVADEYLHRVCVFAPGPDGAALVRSWGREGTGDGQFEYPNTLTAVGQHLYVMEANGRVQVFE